MSNQANPVQDSTRENEKEAQQDKVAPAPVIQLKPILEAQEKHGPIFRRELFDIAYESWTSINQDDPEDDLSPEDDNPCGRRYLRTKAVVADIYGIKRETPFFREHRVEHNGKESWLKRCWIYNDIQEQAWHIGYYTDPLLPFDFAATPIPVQKDNNDAMALDFHAQAAELRTEWETSENHHRLASFLEKHAGNTPRPVDQIICFGLSSPFPGPHASLLRRPYIQHLAACTVRDIFAQAQPHPTPRIFAQDPTYTPSDVAYLSAHFSITVLADPEGFRALSGSTFVISIATDVPVRQVALGMTHDEGGPAGFLCDAIRSDGLEGEGMTRHEAFNGDKKVYYTCNSSPALWEYKQESNCVEWDDREGVDWFGRAGCYLKKSGGGGTDRTEE